MRNDFCIFILTHGRADNQITVKTLKKTNYDGDIYFVVDDEDKQKEKYIELYGEKVLIFNKKEQAEKTDTMNNNPKMNVILYARNVCFEFAKKLNKKYFVEFDDDYTDFEFRTVKNDKLLCQVIYKMNEVIDAMIEWLDSSENIKTVAFSQGGDLIGGKGNGIVRSGYKRKAMNSFFCSVEKPFQFIGCINEDVNTYTRFGNIGDIFFTTAKATLIQKTTQKNKGGMSETYIDNGTYEKSFYSVMVCPSFVKIGVMGDTHKRIHHNVNSEYGYPKIIREDIKLRGVSEDEQ